MKLAAIYNIFDGVELLKGSMQCLAGHVDMFILVVQKTSNFGDEFDGFDQLDFSEFDQGTICIIRYEPINFGPGYKQGAWNEIKKRQIGIDMAKSSGCTHFLCLDCDEYHQDFGGAVQEYLATGADGSVCPLFSYFSKPIYRTEFLDNYYVPFIHKLHSWTDTGVEKYPFYVDPTRRINTNDVVKLQHVMHHFTWIRKDIAMKVRNSTARQNILKSNLLEDYWSKELESDPEGYLVQGLGQRLTVVDNIFNIQV